MEAVETHAADVGAKPVCEALGLSRATFYRSKAGSIVERESAPDHPASPRALSSQEGQEVLNLVHGQRFMDQAPREIYATLLDEGRYVWSVRTM
jgi:putative transposase